MKLFLGCATVWFFTVGLCAGMNIHAVMDRNPDLISAKYATMSLEELSEERI